MRKLFFIFSVCFILLFTLLPQANPAPNDPVNIPDAALRTVIEGILNKTAGDTITEAEMNGITAALDATDKGITDLTGLEHATSMTTMTLSQNNITDLSPLEDLTQLDYLNFDGSDTDPAKRNAISDLSPLDGLTALRELHLAWNPIRDLAPLSGLTGLTLLYLDQAEIEDISAEVELSALESLNLYGTTIDPDDLNNLRATGLTWLRLWLVRKINPRTGVSERWSDLTPFVELVESGNIGTPYIDLRVSLNLNYESLYTHLPALRAAGITSLDYSPSVPNLHRHSPEEDPVVGRPRTAHTLVVRASNTTTYSPNAAPYVNPAFSKVPVTFSVDGEVVSTRKTDANGLARVTIWLGNHGETRTVTAVVLANAPPGGPSHDELPIPPVTFTATADRDAPPPPGSSAPTVTYEDYPEDRPTEEFTLTIEFSEPVTGFQTENITVETELKAGTGTATLETLTPLDGTTFTDGEGEIQVSAQTYTAKIQLNPRTAGTVTLIVHPRAATSSVSGIIGPLTDTASELIRFGSVVNEDIYPRRPPALVVTQIDFAKGMFSVQNTTQYRFNVEMKIYSEDHRDKWFKVSERALIAIEDAETLTFSLTPVETDDASIQHLNSEFLLSQNQNQPLELSAEKFCIKLIRVIPVDIASNMPEDLRFTDPRWAPPGDVIFRQYDAGWDVKLQGMRRDHLVYRRFPLDGRLLDSWDVEVSVPAAPSISRGQVRKVFWKWADVKYPDSQKSSTSNDTP